MDIPKALIYIRDCFSLGKKQQNYHCVDSEFPSMAPAPLTMLKVLTNQKPCAFEIAAGFISHTTEVLKSPCTEVLTLEAHVFMNRV